MVALTVFLKSELTAQLRAAFGAIRVDFCDAAFALLRQP